MVGAGKEKPKKKLAEEMKTRILMALC